MIVRGRRNQLIPNLRKEECCIDAYIATKKKQKRTRVLLVEDLESQLLKSTRVRLQGSQTDEFYHLTPTLSIIWTLIVI